MPWFWMGILIAILEGEGVVNVSGVRWSIDIQGIVGMGGGEGVF